MKTYSEIIEKAEVLITVSFKIKLAMLPQFKEALAEIINQIDGQQHLQFLNWLSQEDDTTSIILFEGWNDKEYFLEEEMKKPYRKVFADKTNEMLEKPLLVQFQKMNNYIFNNKN